MGKALHSIRGYASGADRPDRGETRTVELQQIADAGVEKHGVSGEGALYALDRPPHGPAAAGRANSPTMISCLYRAIYAR